MKMKGDYSLLPSGHLIDISPMKKGKNPQIWKDKKWQDAGYLKFHQISDSKPVTSREVVKRIFLLDRPLTKAEMQILFPGHHLTDWGA